MGRSIEKNWVIKLSSSKLDFLGLNQVSDEI